MSLDKVLGQVYGGVPVEVVGRGGEEKKKLKTYFLYYFLFFFRIPPPPRFDLAGRPKSILTIPDPASPADRTDPAGQPINPSQSAT